MDPTTQPPTQFIPPLNTELNQSSQLTELLTLTRENNQMLKVMRRNMRLQMIGRVIYFAFIIGIFGAGLYVIKPYLQTTLDMYKQAQSSLQSVTDIKTNLSNVFGE